MNKHIEEMAIDLAENIVEVWNNNWNQYVFDNKATAENMIKEGYRKASDVAREIFEEIEDLWNTEYVLGNLTAEQFKDKYAELKKKYESEGAE